jgi:hypothetical protein
LYIGFFKRFSSLSSGEKSVFDALEARLSLEQILYFRELARSEIEREEKIRNRLQNEVRSCFFFFLFFFFYFSRGLTQYAFFFSG